MTSPGARQRRRRQQYRTPRTRAELMAAAGASIAIVGGTAFMIWLLRPGGLADRQPRSSWLVAIVIIASVIACYLILRPKSRLKMSRRVALSGALGVIAVAAVLTGVFWPGGIVRHTPSFPATVPLPSSTAIPGATTTPPTAGTQTTRPPKTTTSGSTPPVSTGP